MKTLLVHRGSYGSFFFKGNELISYIHENDGDYRAEYMNEIFSHFGIEVKNIDKLTKKQAKIVEETECDE